jgi:hypothetical protein
MNIIFINHKGNVDVHEIIEHNNLLNHIRDLENDNNYEYLYNWKYNNFLIKVFGINMKDRYLENIHTLPPHGASSITDIESNKLKLYNNIYIAKFDLNNKLHNYEISEYGELFAYYTDYLNMDSDDSDCSDDYSDGHINDNNVNINNVNTKTNNIINNYGKLKSINKSNKSNVSMEIELDTDTTKY